MKNILILHTGGTFGMVHLKPTETLAPRLVQKRITEYVPELENIAEIDFQSVFNMDSANLQPHHWQTLAGAIHRELEHYDGFVVIHGTDSMAYTAAALSFMLCNLSKPVILTGSQRPLAEIRTDARSNLINAVELATRNIPEVAIFFGTALYRGNRTIKVSSSDFGAFVSPNYPILAEVGVDIKVATHILSPQGVPGLKTALSTEVLAIPYFPGLQPDFFQRLAESELKAIVVAGLGMGNVAIAENSLVPAIDALTSAGKLVVITSQSRHGCVDLTRYENGKLICEAGAIGAGDMTTEATIVKLMCLLGQEENNPASVKQRLGLSLAGEVSEK